jgi:putative ABC transport system permease protein
MDPSGWLENVRSNCRSAARRLRQNPGFAAAAILTLTLGIGANVAMFTVVRTVLLSPLRGDILRVALNEAARIVIARVGVGLLGSLLLTRLLQTLLFDIKPTDPLTFGALTILLTGVALSASFILARRASRIDPLVASA